MPMHKAIYPAFLGACALILFFYNLNLVFIPYQFSPTESLPVLFTRRLLEGLNPYNQEMMPTYANVYGVLYNLIILPFASIFEPTLALHRAVSELATIATSALIFVSLRKVGANSLVSFNLALIWWAQTLVLYSPLARVDALANLFFMLAISIPFLCKMSRRSFYFAAIFAILTFFIKQYFLLSALALAVASFFCFGLVFSILLSSAMFMATVFLLAFFDYIFPTYIENTILVGAGLSGFSLDVLVQQLIHLARENVFFIGLILIFLIQEAHSWGNRRIATADLNLKRDSLKWLKNLPVDRLGRKVIRARVKALSLIWISTNYHLTVAIIILPFVLIAQSGLNSYEGAYITQLLTPLLIVVLAKYAIKQRAVLLAGCASVSLVWAISAFPVPERPGDRQAHREWTEIISEKNNIFAQSFYALWLDDIGKPIYSAGANQNYQYAFQNIRLGNAYQMRRLIEFEQSTNRMILEKKFDLVVLRQDGTVPPVILDNYRYVRSMRFPIKQIFSIRIGKMKNQEFFVDLWEPKEMVH